ncbi:EamA family transporter [Novosphingobium sp. Gsoil 351]|nr:EamA family transporter [Novosphingobium sp. Gsoil 351]
MLFALGGFSLLSVGDAAIKTIAGAWPGTAVALTRYTIGTAMLGILLWRREGRAGFRLLRLRWHLLRGFAVGIATVAFFSALFVMPIAEATSITFTSPMLTALLAAAFLGERLRPVSVAAMVLAFCGVAIVLRPSFAALGLAALLPLLSALGMSFLMLGNRVVAGSGSALAMQFAVAALALPVIAAATLVGHWSGLPQYHVGAPDWSILARCAIVAGTATTAHWLVFLGTERTGVARVAPMSYVQMLMALGLGWALFADRPDWIALAGAAVIIAGGLLLWWSGRVTEPSMTD